MPITILGPSILKTVASFLLAVLPVSIKNQEGRVLQGELAGFTSSSVKLKVDGAVVEYPFDDLALLRPEDPEERTGPPIRVTLVGGSKVAAQDVSLTESELVIEPRRQNQLLVPVKQVKSIRFRASSEVTDPQWLGILDRDSRGDTLVIRRPGDRLDPLQGVIVSIADGKVAFDLDGDVVNAPIDRLEGIVFGGTQPVNEDALIRVTDIYGSIWAVDAIESSQAEQPLQMKLSPGILQPLPVHQIESIRFSGGLLTLADSKPASASFRSYLGTGVDKKWMNDFFGAVREQEADLVMVGGSSIEYRLEPGYQTLAGTVRRHPSVVKGGKVVVRIDLDGKTVWEQELRDGEPRGFELPVQGLRRLAITVDSGGDGDMGDTVLISRPRLLK